MNRIEFHRQARILQGEAYDGNLIDNLVTAVEEAETRHQFYRGEKFRVTTADTPSTPATSRFNADNCKHCHANYGHKIWCPLINRQSAEAMSAIH